MEDNFSTDGAGVEGCGGWGYGSGGNASDGGDGSGNNASDVRDGSGGNASDGGDGSGGNASDGERQVKLCSCTTHFLLCSPVPNRPRSAGGPWPGGWGPLL